MPSDPQELDNPQMPSVTHDASSADRLCKTCGDVVSGPSDTCLACIGKQANRATPHVTQFTLLLAVVALIAVGILTIMGV